MLNRDKLVSEWRAKARGIVWSDEEATIIDSCQTEEERKERIAELRGEKEPKKEKKEKKEEPKKKELKGLKEIKKWK